MPNKPLSAAALAMLQALTERSGAYLSIESATVERSTAGRWHVQDGHGWHSSVRCPRPTVGMLQAKGYVERVGDLPGRYRISAKGRAALSAQTGQQP